MRIIYCFLCCLVLQSAMAQNTLDNRMNLLARSKPYGTLFVHFDKNVYSNNETIYFTAYLINSAVSSLKDHQILCVSLVREIDTTLVLTDKFPVQGGLSMGTIILPDSIQSGNYRLQAYTNQTVNGAPEVSFIQKITIKTNFDRSYKANIKLLETTKTAHPTHQILFSATTNDNRFLPKPISINYRYGNLKKSAKTDASGQVVMSIPVDKNAADPNLYVKLTGEKDTSYLSLALPMGKNKASVRFFPEGGNSINGLPNYVAWEVKDQQKLPLAVKAFLFENDTVIDTIETGSYGIGKFNLFYKHDAKYTVKLIHDGLADSIYTLPKALDKGLILSVLEAATADSVSFTLRSKEPMTARIRLHNFRETFVDQSYNIKIGHHRFKILLTDLPRGLATLTVTDSLDRPLAERMIFVHYSTPKKMDIASDKPQYSQREEVTLKLQLNHTVEKALVSIAVVQSNRLDPLKTTDIETYTYLQNEIDQVPLSLKASLFMDRPTMEQILLVKGWRRYNWQDLQPATTLDTTKSTPKSLAITGKVWKKNKELKEPVSLTLLGHNSLQLINTSPKGEFKLTEPELFTEAGRKTYFIVNDKFKENFKVKIDDEFILFANKIKNFGAETTVVPSTLTNNAELVIKGNEKAIRLNEVVIKATKDSEFNFFRGSPGANACGDYVCSYNIFNCRNHVSDPGNTAPIAGRTYAGLTGPYQECKTYANDESVWPFKGVHFAKEFYQNDYKDPNEPAFFSTIYWNYGLLINDTKPSEIKFFTSDILGKFRVVVQGISSTNVVHGEHTFDVLPKKQ